MDPLVAQIRAFEFSHPYGYVRETDPEAREYRAYAVVRPPPGDEWYGPLGDVINNLRAALDHAVFGLSWYCLGRRLTEREARSISWPVISRPEAWDEFVGKKKPSIRFLSDPYKELVEDEQPYRGSNEYIRTSHPVHVLDSLWNVDKHRQIHFVAAAGKVMAMYVPGDFSVPHRLTPAVVDNGSQVVHVPFGAVNSQEDLSPLVQVEVTLQNGGPPRNPVTGSLRPLGGLLGEMHSSVFGILQGFTDLLERGIR
jgi:hypothetical protein